MCPYPIMRKYLQAKSFNQSGFDAESVHKNCNNHMINKLTGKKKAEAKAEHKIEKKEKKAQKKADKLKSK